MISEAVIGLAGILIGVLAQQCFAIFSENRRWRREDRFRFGRERRELYGRLLNDCRTLVFNFGLLNEDSLNRIDERAMSTLAEIEILASKEVLDAAKNLYDKALQARLATPDAKTRLELEVGKQSNAFCDAARKELDVK